ncbi:MAG: hypothetical protein ACJ75S_06935 [Solirubrobacterales bacterium]
MPKHFGYRGRTHLELDFHLVVGDNIEGMQRPSVRVSADRPQLKRNERAINLKMNVPLALFRTPQLAATINIADPGESAVKIDVDAISAAVRGAIGMDVDIQVVDQHGQVIE